MGMKARAYILTFLTYASVHMMRMTYSFNKHNFEIRFGIGDLFLGFLDAFIFITLAIGTIFRYSLLNSKNFTLVCLQTSIPTALAFSLIPITSLFKTQSLDTPSTLTYLFLLLSIGCFGFFQFAFFPALITIFSTHFNVKTDGSLVGFWSSKSNVGNIFGFFLANFMVYQLGKRWEITMIFCSIVHIAVALLLYWLVQNIDDQKDVITTSQFFRFMTQKWKSLDFKLYILSFSFFKAILYSYQLWTPSFLVDSGFAQYSGYVPMVFDIFTLFGSYFMGKLYQQDHQQLHYRSNVIDFVKMYKYFISSFLVSAACLLYALAPPNITMYFFLAAFMGIFLGGVYNSLQNSQILSYTKNNPRNTDMLSTVNIGVGSSMVGVFQLIIGVFVHLGQQEKGGKTHMQDQKHFQSGVIYVVIAILGFVAMILTFLRSYFAQETQLQIEQLEMEEINTALAGK